MTNLYLEKIAEMSSRDSTIGTGIQIAGGAALAGAALLTGKAFRNINAAKRYGKKGETLYAKYRERSTSTPSPSESRALNKMRNRVNYLHNMQRSLRGEAEDHITNSLIAGGIGTSALGVGHAIKNSRSQISPSVGE